MRALEKDRNRRYDSANSFADDIERHLNDDAVEANPPSLAYRIWKSYRRNRAEFYIGGMVAASLVVCLVAALLSARIARNGEIQAERARQMALKERERAEQAAQIADTEAQSAAKTLNVLVSFLSMTTANPGTGSEYTVREALSELAQFDASNSAS